MSRAKGGPRGKKNILATTPEVADPIIWSPIESINKELYALLVKKGNAGSNVNQIIKELNELKELDLKDYDISIFLKYLIDDRDDAIFYLSMVNKVLAVLPYLISSLIPRSKVANTITLHDDLFATGVIISKPSVDDALDYANQITSQTYANNVFKLFGTTSAQLYKRAWNVNTEYRQHNAYLLAALGGTLTAKRAEQIVEYLVKDGYEEMFKNSDLDAAKYTYVLHKGASVAEREIFEHDPRSWAILATKIEELVDERSSETIKRYGPLDWWSLIVGELKAIGAPTMESYAELYDNLQGNLYEEDSEQVLIVLKHKMVWQSFIEGFPIL